MKKERLSEIQSLLKKHQIKFNENKLNCNLKVLISEKNSKNQLVGKSPYNQTVIINERVKLKIEKSCSIKQKDKFFIGKMKNVNIINAYQNSLEGVFLDNFLES